MNAITRKMKDGSWTAETQRRRMNFMKKPAGTGLGSTSGKDIYPIVSPSDIEWLEKNNMDGKDVDGYTKGGVSFHLKDVPSGRVIPSEMQAIADYLDNMAIPKIPAAEKSIHKIDSYLWPKIQHLSTQPLSNLPLEEIYQAMIDYAKDWHKFYSTPRPVRTHADNEMTKEHFFSLIGADKYNANANIIWDCLIQNNFKIIKQTPKP